MRFDKHMWSARLYTTAAEIETALKAFGAFDKKIKDVHVIGVAHNMEESACAYRVRRTLAAAGVPYEHIDSGMYPYIEDTLLPCELVVCEPMVFVFEDDSTVELLPCGDRGLWLGVNGIAPDILDGTNDHNFDSSAMFRRLQGYSVTDVRVLRRQIPTVYGRFSATESNTTVKYEISFGYACGVCFKQSYDGWYTVSLFNGRSSTCFGDEIYTIPYREIKAMLKPKNQITIVEGHDSTSYFWIMPVKHVPKSEEYWCGIQEYRQEKISIEEDDVGVFLYYFLDKYFDCNYPYGDSRECCGNHFEWNLEYNIYTYETMCAMLADIEHCCYLLKTDYDNVELDGLKAKFHYYPFSPVRIPLDRRLTEEEEQAIIRDNIHVATEFYDRFVSRMRGMMQHATDYNLISFMGP